ncbi:hypothetical protein [Pseudomonas grandcourensis]|uniref:hypothetical protein n=1 Tax=Pseudomonas grandcourensis TaxID=3136736 RepID=UPI003262EF09
MHDTVDVRFIRRASSALCAASVVVLLGACAHPTPPDSIEPKSWVIENVAAKTTAELYADLIAPAVFERSGSKVIDGYTVESGNLRMPDKSMGSLITVRAKDGSLTAIIEVPGKQGILRVNADGKSIFTREKYPDSSVEDSVISTDNLLMAPSSSKTTADNEPRVIEVLAGFSRAYANVVVDPHAFSLAEMETVNLALRNSLVTNVSMKLAGIQIVEPNYLASKETLHQLLTIFSSGIDQYAPDVVAGFFNGEGSPAVGYGNMPGRTSVNAGSFVFRHEIGHNASGFHCSPSDPASGYGFGYNTSIMCGAWYGPYYSTPLVRDENGQPRGDALTADMARAFRENAMRLSTYTASPATNFRKTGSTITKITFGWDQSNDAVRYDVYRETPAQPQPQKIAETVSLTYTAADSSGRSMYFVKAINSAANESKPSNKASR